MLRQEAWKLAAQASQPFLEANHQREPGQLSRLILLGSDNLSQGEIAKCNRHLSIPRGLGVIYPPVDTDIPSFGPWHLAEASTPPGQPVAFGNLS
jgi:hypothetical protein